MDESNNFQFIQEIKQADVQRSKCINIRVHNSNNFSVSDVQ